MLVFLYCIYLFFFVYIPGMEVYELEVQWISIALLLIKKRGGGGVLFLFYGFLLDIYGFHEELRYQAYNDEVSSHHLTKRKRY